MRRVLLDFGAIKSGGGVQLALNFFEELSNVNIDEFEFHVLRPEIGPLAKEPLSIVVSEFILPANPAKRFLFEILYLPHIIKKLKIDVIYTFFGAGLPHSSAVKSVVGVAYPIICYPDSDYWTYVPYIQGVKKRLINSLRRRRLFQATQVIAETEVMRQRLIEYVGLDEKLITVMAPSPTEYVTHQVRTPNQGPCADFVFLFLSGASPHKNLWRLPQVAKCLLRKGFCNFKFFVTTSRSALLGHNINDRDILDRHFCFLESVHPKEIDALYGQCDVLVNLSDMESFSNNYMEAWKAGVPLLVSDRDFAKHICGLSAIYVEPHDCEDVADKMINIAQNENLRHSLIIEGERLYKNLPSLYNRVQEILSLLRN